MEALTQDLTLIFLIYVECELVAIGMSNIFELLRLDSGSLLECCRNLDINTNFCLATVLQLDY